MVKTPQHTNMQPRTAFPDQGFVGNGVKAEIRIVMTVVVQCGCATMSDCGLPSQLTVEVCALRFFGL